MSEQGRNRNIALDSSQVDFEVHVKLMNTPLEKFESVLYFYFETEVPQLSPAVDLMQGPSCSLSEERTQSQMTDSPQPMDVWTSRLFIHDDIGGASADAL